MRAKKSLGQHFLKSERALSKIVEAGRVSAEDFVLEIGPGTGALTEKLLATSCQVLAIEKDNKLHEFLKIKFEKFISVGKLKLIHGDILEFDLSKLEARSYKLVANIPYNITGAILKKFLGAKSQPERMVLLVQKEVAERIVGTSRHSVSTGRKESILSISVKVYGTPRYVETVKAGSFVPSPKVDSAIIAIDDISKAFFQKIATDISPVDTPCLQLEEKFFKIVRVGFKSKRKKLSSNLGTVFGKSKVLKVFKKLGLDDNLRAEDTDVKTWQKLAQNLLPEQK